MWLRECDVLSFQGLKTEVALQKLQLHPKLEHNKDAVKLFFVISIILHNKISLIIALNPAKIMMSVISLTLLEPLNTT